MRPRFTWNLGSRTLELGTRTLVMGVLNVTPDSFSDGGLYFDSAAAVAHALQMLEEGADILDIGGESTRPGAAATATADELARILPVIRELRRRRPDCVVSVDTYKSETARQAVAAGAEIVNDVSGFTWDEHMDRTLGDLGCGAIVMHTRGRPSEWRSLPRMDEPVATVKRELAQLAEHALGAGISRDRIVLDPGFGFGKNFEENYPLVAGLEQFHELGFPLMVGVSRKSFLRRAAAGRGLPDGPAHQLAGSVAAAVICATRGAHIVRVHDVGATVQALAVSDAVAESATRDGNLASHSPGMRK